MNSGMGDPGSAKVDEPRQDLIIDQANEIVAQLSVGRIRRAQVCGCFSCKAAARDFIAWLADGGEMSAGI
jgi:hypothetical protein